MGVGGEPLAEISEHENLPVIITADDFKKYLIKEKNVPPRDISGGFMLREGDEAQHLFGNMEMPWRSQENTHVEAVGDFCRMRERKRQGRRLLSNVSFQERHVAGAFVESH